MSSKLIDMGYDKIWEYIHVYFELRKIKNWRVSTVVSIV